MSVGARVGWGFVLLAALALWSAAARAAELQFTASVDQTTVGLSEQFQLVLTVQGEDMVSVPSPSVPAMPGLDVLGRTSSQSTNISFINGQIKKQASVSFIYILAARRMGKCVIPACKLTYQGRTYESQPIEITVVKPAQGQTAPAPGAAPPGVPAPRGQVPIEGNLFLSAVPSRRTAYVGEPVALEVALGTRFQITNGAWASVPAFDGFWAEKVSDAERLDFARRTIDGKAFGVCVLKKVILFPLSPGETTIKPMAFEVAVTQPSRDLFDLFGATQTVRLESKPVAIHVLPLPEADKPKEFTGGVGAFTLAAALDRSSTTNSEPANLTVKVSGRGNLRLVDAPAVAPVPGLRILPPESKDDAHVVGDALEGTRTFRFPVIPERDGRFVIAPVALAYFDPQAKAYRTLRAGPFELSASGSAPAAPLAAEGGGLKVLGSDIAFIKPDAVALAVVPMRLPWWPNLLYVLSLGVVGYAVWYRGHRERLLTDRGYARMSRSSGLVKRRLRLAEKRLGANDEQGFYAALSQAVVGYVGDRFNIETQAMTKDQLRAELEGRQVAPETSAAVLEILDQCETARFSPGLVADRDPRRLFERTRDALGRI